MGSICAQVKYVEKDFLDCEIQNDGIIYENSQVTFAQKSVGPGSNVDPMDTREEHIYKKDIRFCLENDIDYIIHSVYHGKQEVLDIKKCILEENDILLKEQNYTSEVKIIAKLENEDAIKDLDGILDIADCILIPRGVLGTVLPIEKISWIQKKVIKYCN